MQQATLQRQVDKAKPLVSFCVKCYNQADLIGEALKGAFEQTYTPLEILVSDDGSTDGSLDVIHRLVDEYRRKGGKHSVTVIANPKNLGNGGNWQKLCSVAKGEWLVKADGDDRSLPDRTAKMMEAWERSDKKAKAIAGDAVFMDMQGRCLGPVKRGVLRTDCPAGGVAAYHRSLFDNFGDLIDPTAWDDSIYSARSRLLSETPPGFLFVDVPVILYRIGRGTCHGTSAYRSVKVRMSAGMHKWVNQIEHDLKTCKVPLSPTRIAAETEYCRQRHAGADYCLRLWNGPWHVRARMVLKYPLRWRFSLTGFLVHFLILPFPIADVLLDLLQSLDLWRKSLKYRHVFDSCAGDGEKLARACEALFKLGM